MIRPIGTWITCGRLKARRARPCVCPRPGLPGVVGAVLPDRARSEPADPLEIPGPPSYVLTDETGRKNFAAMLSFPDGGGCTPPLPVQASRPHLPGQGGKINSSSIKI